MAMIEDAGRFDGKTLLWPDRPSFHGAGPYALVDEDVLGCRVQVFRERPQNVGALVASAARFGDQPAFVFDDGAIDFAQYAQRVASVAARLAERYEIGPGDRVALLGSNSAAWVVAFSAITSLGAIAVALNGWWVEGEIRHGIELTTPKLVLADRRRLPRVPALASVGIAVREMEAFVAEGIAAAPGASLPATLVGEDDPAVILFTSGTTGRPKGAVQSHRNLMVLATCTGHVTSQISVDPAAAPPCSLYLLPLFHVSGLQGGLIHTLMLGWKSVWVSTRFDERRVFALTERERVTTWSVVPSQLYRLLEHPAFHDYDLSSIRSVGGGGSAWPPSLTELVHKQLPSAVAAMSFGFGQTESAGMGTANNGPPLLVRPDSAGRPRPTMELQIRDERGEACAEGVEGEICLRGPAVFLGYWNDPAATRAVLDEDRWLSTGDIGHLEDGLLFVAGRRGDLVIRGGENIYPAEIEAALLAHPAVAEAAVFGVAHRVLGEEVKAVIRPHDGEVVGEAALRAWLAPRIAPFKIPAIFAFTREPLPRNVTGKILKHVLRDGSQNIFQDE
ncbi:MAG: acyl--CoA ligase [Deltaproteobacteria bacterium]|nr:acyl--CoA ligase [Deltaproteobacteria bacterium]